MIYIMHLSDFHIVDDPNWNNMKTCLLNTLKDEVQGVTKGQMLLVLSGDFHNWIDKDYDKAKKCINLLVKTLGLDIVKDVFMVPGNHDLYSTRKTDLYLSKIQLLRYTIDPLNDKNTVTLLLEPFKRYCDFCRSLGLYQQDPESTPACIHVRVWNNKLNLLHLNTALIADGENKDGQVLDINTLTGDKLYHEIHDNKRPTIAIGHNNFYDLNMDIKRLTATRFGFLNVKAYLCGDNHKFNNEKEKMNVEYGPGYGTKRFPNIVCGKCSTDAKDHYSDFGFLIHIWNEETGEVIVKQYEWKRDEDQSKFVVTYGAGQVAYNLSGTDMVDSIHERIQARNIEIINKSKNIHVFPELFAPVSIEDGDEKDNLTEAVFAATDQLKDTKPILLTARGGQGKTTQMLSLLESLTKHKNDDHKYDCSVLFCQLSDYERNADKDLLHDFLDKYYQIVEEKDQDSIIKDMKRKYNESKHHYFLLLDGLDEADPDVIDSIKSFAQEKNNVQIIIAGRSNGLFLGRETINMVLKDLRPEKAEQWLRKHYEGRKIAENRISTNPMLLILAYKVTNNLKRYDENTHYVGINGSTPLKLGEVLWNYSEYLLRKACVHKGITDKEKRFAIRFMHAILPHIAYKYFFDSKEKKNSATKFDRYELRETLKTFDEKDVNTDEAIETIKKTCIGILHYNENDDRFAFDHKLFMEFYAMMYISKLIDGNMDNDLTKGEYEIIGNDELLDNLELNKLLLYTLPFSTELFASDYKKRFISILDRKIRDTSTSEAQIQALAFIRAMYELWYINDYETLDPDRLNELSDVGWKALEYMTFFVELAEKELNSNQFVLQIDCLSYIYYILSQLYRTGEIFPSKKLKTQLYDFDPDLNQSFRMTYKAISLCNNSSDVVDGYNYLGHLFSAACDHILESFYYNTEIKTYTLSKDDLIINLEETPRVFDIEFSDYIPSGIANAKPGDSLNIDEVKARLQCFTRLVHTFFLKGLERGCILSMNVLALSEDQGQERKPKADRDYTAALRLFLQASDTDRFARFYSAQKAAQILAQKRASLNDHDESCLPEQADEEKTCKKVIELLEIAASANSETWGMNHFYKGEMIFAYSNDGNRVLDNDQRIKAAYDEYTFAKEILADKNISMPLILGLLKAGFEMIKVTAAKDDEVISTVRTAINLYPKSLASLVRRAQLPPKRNEWMPSYFIIREYIDEMKAYAKRYKNEIEQASLMVDMNQCIEEIKMPEDELENWNTNKGKHSLYYELLKETELPLLIPAC